MLDQAHAEAAQLREKWLSVKENKEKKEWMEANAHALIPAMMHKGKHLHGPNSAKNDDDDSD